MSRYSSDSDSSDYRRSRKRKKRSRSSSSDSSRHRRSRSSKHSSSSRYKKSSKSYSSKSYRRSRSRSKNSSRHSRSESRDRDRYRRSRSRDKYRSKHHYKSKSSSKSHGSKHHSRSSSSDSKSSSSSTNSSKSSSTNNKKDLTKNVPANSCNPDEQLREKLLKAIKAAESADHLLKQQGVLPKGVKSRNDLSNLTSTKPQSEVLNDINADEFVPKSFKSSKQNTEGNFDDLNIPTSTEIAKPIDVDENSIFHASFFVDPKIKMERWVKKLFMIRQRAIVGEPLAT